VTLGIFIIIWSFSEFTIFGMAPQQAPGWTSLMLVLLFLSGINFVFMGILGEYLRVVVDEVKQRPNYIIMDNWSQSIEHKNENTKAIDTYNKSKPMWLGYLKNINKA
jgi:hypothetical protein